MLQNLFRSYFARFMYPLAQAFVLNKILRGVIFCTPFWLYDIWLTWKVRSNFFFWDTIQLASQHALFFYNNTHFSTFLLPDEMDSGHPPTFGFYLALVWRIFGKSLEISHLAILPFLLGIVWQAWKLGEKIVGEGWALLFLLLLTVCPVVAGQAVLVSPDIVLLLFFLMALNGIFNTINFQINTSELNSFLNLKDRKSVV